MPHATLLQLAKRIKAIADVGLLYTANDYDKERYHELLDIYAALLAEISDKPLTEIKRSIALPADYPTAKVDIRGFAVRDGKVLLVKEQADHKWSLPGGWADVGFSPKEIVVKEFREETGLDVEPLRLLAVFDKRMHPHPSHLHTVYKLVFHCHLLNDNIQKGFDVLDVGYFPLDALPQLSEERIVKSQIELLAGLVARDERMPYVD